MLPLRLGTRQRVLQTYFIQNVRWRPEQQLSFMQNTLPVARILARLVHPERRYVHALLHVALRRLEETGAVPVGAEECAAAGAATLGRRFVQFWPQEPQFLQFVVVAFEEFLLFLVHVLLFYVG